MDVWFALGTGVVSGIVAAGLLLLTRTLVVGYALPWYQDLIYRGINVDGTWFASCFGMAQDIRISLEQGAGNILGDAQFSTRPDESDDLESLRVFDIEGRIQDRYVTLTLSHRNRQRIGVVTLLLEPICDGRQLRGVMSFWSIRTNRLDSIEIHFARDISVVVAGRKMREDMIELSLDRERQPELDLPRPKPKRRVRTPKDAEVAPPEKVLIE